LLHKLYISVVAVSIIFIALYFYLLFPFYRLQHNEVQGFYFAPGIHSTVLKYGAVLYAIYQVILLYTSKQKSKLELFLEGIKNQQFTTEDWKNIRYFWVKFFFIPLMLPSAIIYFNYLIELLQTPTSYSNFILFFNRYIFSAIIYTVSFVTLGYYSFGYLIESKRLNSTVKSVDNTILGWTVLLICYVPFFVFVTQIIPFPTQDYAFFINNEITFVVRIVLSLLMLLKMYAVVTLGAKCSNLTNRGIVTSGLYRYIRHPHYLAKLLVWWITFLPYLVHHFWALGAMIFWTIIYFMRALTEEKHLSKDKAYRTYKKNVKWMFIPKVI